ncbi:hypothetical protein BJX96DRAFT_155222 [Aspergillus floccosus]
MSALEARLRYTLIQCESLFDKLTELKNRLSAQTEVSYNLIAQRNSLVNLTVAQQQANDSRTVKAIAILTLICLPSTLVATLWTAGLFHLEGNKNWQVYIAVSLALTLVVLLCWRLYVLVSEKRKERPSIDNLFIAQGSRTKLASKTMVASCSFMRAKAVTEKSIMPESSTRLCGMYHPSVRSRQPCPMTGNKDATYRIGKRPAANSSCRAIRGAVCRLRNFSAPYARHRKP